jgi:hypothetical protein
VRAIVFVACMFICAVMQAQTTQVIELSKAEAAQAKALYAEQEKVREELLDLRRSIAAKYELPPTFEFSDDFRFVVPANNVTFCPPSGSWATPGSLIVNPVYDKGGAALLNDNTTN